MNGFTKWGRGMGLEGLAYEAVAIGAVTALGIAIALQPGSTDPSLIRARGPRAAFRRWRTLWLKGVLAMLGWPHLVEVAAGSTRCSVEATPSEEVWRDGPAQLLRYAGARTRRTPILVVHALVSRHWILDLPPDGSLVGALVADGYDVFLLDLGEPGSPVEAMRGFDAYTQTLLGAEGAVARLSGAERVHLVGYCSSASLVLARLGAFQGPRVASTILIAPPVDLATSGGMPRLMRNRLVKPALLLDADGMLPAAVVRESFHLLRPRALRTVLARVRDRHDAAFVERYDPLSRWAWSHRKLPGKLVFDTIDLFRTNGLIQGTLRVCGRPVSLPSICSPILALVAERDHIVPADSSAALEGVEGLDVTMVRCPSGHVSMLTGSGARSVLRPAILTWLGDREPAASRAKRKRPASGGGRRRSTREAGASRRSTGRASR